MGTNSKIEWTDHTLNFWRGCTKVSDGCDNCYMYRDQACHGNDPTKVIRCGRVIWRQPQHRDRAGDLTWKSGDKVFVCSWSDFFHKAADDWRQAAWAVIRGRPDLVWIFTTKRIERVADCLPDDFSAEKYPNVIFMPTCENQEMANKRIMPALELKAKYPWIKIMISVEPMLSAMDFLKYFADIECGECDWLGFNDNDTPDGGLQKVYKGDVDWRDHYDEYDPDDEGLWICPKCKAYDSHISYTPLNHPFGDDPRLDGIIAGGESGPGARPMHPDWPRSLRDQCAEAAVPFFFKQWGAYTPDGPGRVVENDVVFLKDGTLKNVKDIVDNWRDYYKTPTDCTWMKRVGKKKAGCLLDGALHKEFPGEKK